MTKDQYLLILQKPEIPMGVWFDYYRERGGIISDPIEFERIFSVMIWNEATTKGSDGNMKKITLNSALRNFYEYYNKKFNI